MPSGLACRATTPNGEASAFSEPPIREKGLSGNALALGRRRHVQICAANALLMQGPDALGIQEQLPLLAGGKRPDAVVADLEFESLAVMAVQLVSGVRGSWQERKMQSAHFRLLQHPGQPIARPRPRA